MILYTYAVFCIMTAPLKSRYLADRKLFFLVGIRISFNLYNLGFQRFLSEADHDF